MQMRHVWFIGVRLAAAIMVAATLVAGAGRPALQVAAGHGETPQPAAAAPATPAAAQGTPHDAAPNTAGLSIVASGLASPRGMDWDGAGALYVGLSGLGGDTPGVGEDMGMSASGTRGGPSASVVKVVAGCGVPVAQGLPSSFDGSAYRGVADVAFLGDDLYALIQIGGPTSGNPGATPGIARIAPDGSATMIFDFPAWLAKNPPSFKSGDFGPNGDPFALVTDGRQLIFGDARTASIIGVSPDGTAERIADLSPGHPVMTGLATDRAGNIYASFLTEAPYAPGTSRVDRVSPDGSVATVWTGLTQTTGVAVGRDGTLYALEMSAGNGMPNGTGRLVRQTGPASSADVVTGLDLPVGLAAGPDGALYVSLPAVPSMPVEGAVLRVDLGASQPMQYAAGALTARPCSGAAVSGAAGHGGMQQPGAATEPTTAAVETAAQAPISRVASDLANPRGMAWGADGALYVAQSGTGDTATSTGPAAGVVRIVDGCPVSAGEGLPSSFDPYKDVLGTQDLLVRNGELFAIVATTGALDDMDPKRPNGIYKVEADGSTSLVADLTTWLNANPVKSPPGDRNSRGEPFRMVENNGGIWFVDSNSGEVDQLSDDGSIVRVADTSAEHMVITALAKAPNGGVYIGSLTPSPHTDGAAKVMVVSADGTVADYWTGLTTVTGVAVSPDGSLWAVEMATGNDTPAGMRPNTGRLVRQNGPDSLDVVVEGLNFPIGLEIGPDGALYIAGPAYGGSDRDGWILRVDPAVTPGTVAPADLMAAGGCAGAQPAAAAGTAGAAGAAGGLGQTVNMEIPAGQDAFSPQTLTVVAGTTVVWTNNDDDAHTVTFDDGSVASGPIANGATFSHTFDTPGTFAYRCEFHPGMTGTVIVVPASAPAATASSSPEPAASPAPSPAPEAMATPSPAAAAATTDTTNPGSAAPVAGAVAVSIANYAFDPATLEVAAGTTVTWTNNDTVPHTVTATDKSFDSGNLAPGATFSHTFATAGSFEYICQYHAAMKATVTVK